MDDILDRIQVAFAAADRSRRLTDFVAAQALFAIPAGVRRRMFAGDAHYCPICESELSQFLVLHRPYHLWCPVCRSLQRHRLIWLFYQRTFITARSGRLAMLHIAPEIGLAERFQRMPNVLYVGADLHSPLAQLRMDICAIPAPDASFDLVQCSHVLEHIPDDVRAVAEMRRVLKPGGHALIVVPITVERTTADASVTDPVQRERLFGQLDHVRRYGQDFEPWLASQGLRVERLTAADLVDEREVRRLGISGEDVLFWCQK